MMYVLRNRKVAVRHSLEINILAAKGWSMQTTTLNCKSRDLVDDATDAES